MSRFIVSGNSHMTKFVEIRQKIGKFVEITPHVYAIARVSSLSLSECVADIRIQYFPVDYGVFGHRCWACMMPSFFCISRTVMSRNFFQYFTLDIARLEKSILHESLRNLALARSSLQRKSPVRSPFSRNTSGTIFYSKKMVDLSFHIN